MASRMTKDEMFTAVSEQRLRLADELDELDDDEWNTPSLCTGWRVRDVVGHLVSILEIPIGRFVFNAVKARSFDTYSRRIGQEFGDRDPDDLVRAYRAAASTRFAPPFVGPIAPLTDVMVHSRDIGRPLGRSSQLDPGGLMVALDYVCGGKARGFVPPSRTDKLRFQASDLDWAVGEGPVVDGTAESILMATTARTAALEDLSGEGAGILASRLAGAR